VHMIWSEKRQLMRVAHIWPYHVMKFAVDTYHGILATIDAHSEHIRTHWIKDRTEVLPKITLVSGVPKTLHFVSIQLDTRVQLLIEQRDGVILIMTPLAA